MAPSNLRPSAPDRKPKAKCLPEVRFLRDCYCALETAAANRFRGSRGAIYFAVRATYGMAEAEDPLASLLGLNSQPADGESIGGKITSPGPLSFPANQSGIETSDCIQPIITTSLCAEGRAIECASRKSS
jgi:hypothetical protein